MSNWAPVTFPGSRARGSCASSTWCHAPVSMSDHHITVQLGYFSLCNPHCALSSANPNPTVSLINTALIAILLSPDTPLSVSTTFKKIAVGFTNVFWPPAVQHKNSLSTRASQGPLAAVAYNQALNLQVNQGAYETEHDNSWNPELKPSTHRSTLPILQ